MGSSVSVMLYDKHGDRLRRIDIVDANITQEINGEYQAFIRTIDKIEAEQIIELEDHDGSLQLFRLSTPTLSLDYYTAQAWHITQDLANDVILNRAWLAQTGAQAWPQLLQAGIQERRFTGVSDIPHVRQLRIVRRNVLESAIGTQDNSFVNRFGGELRRDRYTVDCLTKLGEDRGFRVAVAHNIRGLNIQTDYTQVTNRIIPTVLNQSEAAVELPEIWIDSPNIGLTTVPHTKAMHLGDIWVGREDDDGHIAYPTLDSAYTAARQRIAQMWEDGVDKPSLTVDVDFVQLGQMDQYDSIEDLETLKLGDTVTVVLDGMYYRERMSLYVWDVILKEYRRCILGKPYNTLVAMHNSIEDAYTKAMDANYQTRTLPMITEARKKMAQAVSQAMGYYITTVYEPDGAEKTYTHDEPSLEDSMKIEYYPEPGTKVYTNAGWNNGSPTWLYGQVDGSWIVDVLSAIGVEAQWIRVSSGTTLSDKLTETDALQAELTQAVQGGGVNLQTGSTRSNTFMINRAHWGLILTNALGFPRISVDKIGSAEHITYRAWLEPELSDVAITPIGVDNGVNNNRGSYIGNTIKAGEVGWSVCTIPTSVLVRENTIGITAQIRQVNDAQRIEGLHSVVMSNYKIEAGTLPTTYTRAPEDIEAEIAAAQARAEEAVTKYTRIESGDVILGQVQDVHDRVETTEASIAMVEGALETRVTTDLLQDQLVAIDNSLQGKASASDLSDIIAIQSIMQQTQTDWGVTISQLSAEQQGHAVTLQDVQNYMRFSTEGLEVGHSDSTLSIQITHEAINFIDGGDIVAYITGQTLYINSVTVLSVLQAGNHVTSAYGTSGDITVERWANG